jgi:predicted Zn finger-like uncharacterized protein
MLFTRCPECDTTFRITNEALEKAHGRVRCGRCSSIFNAHAELREAPHDEPPVTAEQDAGEAAERNESSAAAAGTARTASDADGGAERQAEPEHIVLETPTTFTAYAPAFDDARSAGPVRRSEWTLESVGDTEQRSRRWLVAASIAALILIGQIAHHFKAALASTPVIGTAIVAVYSTFGIELAPRWDVRQYQILESEAATASSATGRGNLTIRSRIQNNSQNTQPLPLVRLKLLDRWQEPLGTRVFEPSEYLAAPHAATMAAGVEIQAQLVVVDPGPDAYGYEVDVCVPMQTRYECANDTVFR